MTDLLTQENIALKALGERVASIRSRRGMTRKSLAQLSGVSERHLANLEYGKGNASFLVLIQIAEAMQCTLAELIGDPTTSTSEWLLLRELLLSQSETTLKKIRLLIQGQISDIDITTKGFNSTVALIGLRGAGKTTLGRMLAEDLGFQFVELSREIEKFAGCSIAEIQGLYGVNAYRKYERRALEETIQIYPEAVIATPGGIVSDPASFNLLLNHCTTVWLEANPEDHMERVRKQGDLRPMADNKEAMEDLKKILIGRASFYSQAQFNLNTSAQSLEESFHLLKNIVRKALHISE